MKTFKEVIFDIQSEISAHEEAAVAIETKIAVLSDEKNFHLGVVSELKALIDPCQEKRRIDVNNQSVCPDMVKIKCLTCGKEVTKISRNMKYCSKSCSRKVSNKKYNDKMAMKKNALQNQEGPF